MSNFEEEIDIEKRELLKGLFNPMKLWYNSRNCKDIVSKYGDFPMHWQELEKWNHFKLLKKMYFIISERYNGSDKYDVSIVEEEVISMLNPVIYDDIDEERGKNCSDASKSQEVQMQTSTEVSTNNESEQPSRKKNRWGAPAAPVPLVNSSSSENLAASNPDVGSACTSEKAVSANTDGDSSNANGGTTSKRSRWGAPAATTTSTTTSDTTSNSAPAPARKKSRFSVSDAPAITVSAEAIQQSLIIQVQVNAIGERLIQLPREAFLHDQLPPSERPSSPAPIYDNAGKKINTYEARTREELTNKRNSLIEEMIRINPTIKPPADYVKPKPMRKLPIPVQEYPDYNFIGLIIGPRGNTQKRLEQQTNTHISIRGKGSFSRGGKSTVNVLTSSKSALQNDDHEPLHVLITGDTMENVDACAKVIEEILIPVEEGANEHKMKQLKELALITGNLAVEDYCDICGMQGHRQYECPSRNKTFKSANVKCAHCGEMSHPTRDCPLKNKVCQIFIVCGSINCVVNCIACM